MDNASAKVLSYVRDVLEDLPRGGAPAVKLLQPVAEVPVWINHAARFTEVRLSTGYVFILIEPRSEMTADRLLTLYRITQSALSIPLILVTDEQPHQVRSALRRAHIGLVRSGQYLFAPQFGLHIKNEPKPRLERGTSAGVGAASIAQPFPLFLPHEVIFLAAVILHESLRSAVSLTQFVVEFAGIHARSGRFFISPAKILGRASRAISSFQQRNLVAIRRIGKEKNLSFAAPEVLWASLCRDSQPLVARTVPIFCDPRELEPYPASATSALSRFSDLLPPKRPTIALSRVDWASWPHRAVLDGRIEPNAYAEIWKTNPKYLETKGTVNPLFLALNCRKDPDERVRLAIREMLDSLHISAEPLGTL